MLRAAAAVVAVLVVLALLSLTGASSHHGHRQAYGQAHSPARTPQAAGHAAKQAKTDKNVGQHAAVEQWARTLGRELSNFAHSVTAYSTLQQGLQKVRVVRATFEEVLREVSRRIENLMRTREGQIQAIRIAAQEMGKTNFRSFEVPMPYVGVKEVETTAAPTEPTTTVKYPPATKSPPTPRTTPPATTPKPWLTQIEAFPGGGLINDSLSAVHVPATVYDGRWINLTIDASEIDSTGAEIQQIIELTSALDDVFVKNKREDPTTSWQFFAHHSGVMRQYPASKWNRLYHEDYFDARLRPWYLGAAMSPMDVVILLDNSGSIRMTEPALLTKLIVHKILETLGPDDFVSVLFFNKTVHPLVPGLNKTLIPATSANVRELQTALQDLKPMGMANLSLALETAFLLLEEYRRVEKLGASCNQAVMIVTDLVPEHEEELFRIHNRPRHNDTQTHARVFTFIVGDWAQGPPKEAMWMACANMGWHMNIWKYQSEGVIKYMPVMARPLVLSGMHPMHWSHMYADVTVPGITDLLWADMERDEQLRKITPFCFKDAELHPPAKKHKLGRLPIVDRDLGQNEEYVISVSVSVRNLTKAGVANGELMGVAGVDVPISQITRLIPYHKLGVNAYIFMVTNNGAIVFHPDLRPRFNGILKPGFNSVDMTEVESEFPEENRSRPRHMSDLMRDFREAVVRQKSGNIAMTIMQTYENANRVSMWVRRYFFRGVENTTYSLVLAAPLGFDDRVPVTTEAINNATMREMLNHLCKARGWALHPNWLYCGSCAPSGSWRTSSRDCDPELRTALLVDINATSKWSPRDLKDATAVFFSTYSGLTRWLPLRDDTEEMFGGAKPSRGPDELWYRRAALAHYEAAQRNQTPAGDEPQFSRPHWVVSVKLADEPGADVYSEYNPSYDPEDLWAARRAGLADDWKGYPRPNLTLDDQKQEVGDEDLTISAAIFKDRYPVGVAGARVRQAFVQNLFERITKILLCPEGCPQADTCLSDDLDCFLLDENAVVVADETGTEAGRPLARVNRDLMARLEAAKVYKRITVHDHQAICRRAPGSTASSFSLSSGTCWAATAVAAWWWRLGTAPATPGRGVGPAAALLLAGANGILGAKLKDASTTPEYKFALRNALAPFRVNKTTLQLCDLRMHRFHLVSSTLRQSHHEPLNCDKRSFAAHAVPNTNLVLVMALNKCEEQDQFEPFDVEPQEVEDRGPVYRKEGLLWLRSRPSACFREHADEKHIKHCGAAPPTAGSPPPALAVMAAAVWLVVARL